MNTIGSSQPVSPSLVRWFYSAASLSLFLNPKEFMSVPVLGILMFGLFILVGVLNRYRSLVHRPMMLLASVSVIGAALGRMGPLNALFAGTLWEQLFGAFFTSVILAAIFLLLKCLVSKSFDRWFAVGFVAFTTSCAAITLIAKTAAWDRFATFLLQ